jgi:PST family polysaccharide transporter
MQKILFKIASNKTDFIDLLFQYLIKFVNYLVPFIVIPYLISVLGINSYSKFIFCFALINYFNIIVEFGFDITLTKQIINYRNIKGYYSEIFSFILVFKMILIIISSFLYILIVSYFDLPGDKILYSICFFYLFTGLLNVNSFFYSFNNVRIIAFTNFIFKILYLILVFLFIKKQSDLYIFATFNILSWVLPSLTLFIYIVKNYKLKLKINSLLSKKNKILYIEARNSFFSNLSVSLYGTTNTFILGILGSPGAVVLFDSLEKIFNGFTSIISSSNFVIYPRLIKSFSNKVYFKKILKKIEKIYFVIIMTGVLILFILKDTILEYFNVSKIEYSQSYILLFIIALIFSPFGSFYTRIFLVLGKTKDLLKITAFGFIVNSSILILIFYNNWISIFPITILLTQFYIALTKKIRISNYLQKI